MGITVAAAEILSRWVFEYDISGACLEIARQDVLITEEQLAKILNRIAKQNRRSSESIRYSMEVLEMETGKPEGLASRPDFLAKGFISDRTFFRTLGFTTVKSVDVSGFEGADCVHDFNEDGLADKLDTRFDLAIETGTAEHVFHIPNYLKNISEAVDVGGHVAHFVPANNYLDHGFYQFSPTLFHDYYQANRFEIKEFLLLVTKSLNWRNFKIIPYRPGEYDTLIRDRFDGNFVILAVLARKKQDSTAGVVPQQRIYAQSLSWSMQLGNMDIASLPTLMQLAPPFDKVSGHCWSKPLSNLEEGDSPEHPCHSRLLLLENSVPLGHGHALHRDIQDLGKGRYSHWKQHLLFSTSDNSDPNDNGRRYEIRRLD